MLLGLPLLSPMGFSFFLNSYSIYFVISEFTLLISPHPPLDFALLSTNRSNSSFSYLKIVDSFFSGLYRFDLRDWLFMYSLSSYGYSVILSPTFMLYFCFIGEFLLMLFEDIFWKNEESFAKFSTWDIVNLSECSR